MVATILVGLAIAASPTAASSLYRSSLQKIQLYANVTSVRECKKKCIAGMLRSLPPAFIHESASAHAQPHLHISDRNRLVCVCVCVCAYVCVCVWI